MIEQKNMEIANLKEALSLPRAHYNFIKNLTAERMLQEKNRIMAKLAEQ